MKNYIIAGLLALTSCGPTGVDKSTTDGGLVSDSGPNISISSQEKKKPLLDPLEEAKTLPELIKLISSFDGFVDDKPNLSSKATYLITYWSSFHMKWNDVFVSNNETSFKKSRKDIGEERFKKMCVDGNLIQIEVIKPDDKSKWFVGLMMDKYHNIYHFNAVKGSGDLVEGSFATYCGLVTGLYDYSNSGGGTSHAIDMVGMFDLMENHPEIKSPTIKNTNKSTQNDMY